MDFTNCDAEDIRSRLSLYGFAVDARRWDLFEHIFHPTDLSVRHADNAAWTDFGRFVAGFDEVHLGFDLTRHSMTNFIVEVHGDEAHALTYGQWRLVKFGLPGGDCWSSEGWYEDRLVRTPAGWRITRRQSWEVWGEGNPTVIGIDMPSFRSRCAPLANSPHAQALFKRCAAG